MLLPILISLCVAPQTDAPLPPSPFDRVVEFELAADEALRFEYESEFEGTLHIWTSSEFDLRLRVEFSGEQLLAEDNDSGGGTTPYLRLEVEPGDRFSVFVLGTDSSKPAGDCPMLHLIAAPETQATRAASIDGDNAVRLADRLLEQGDAAKAREALELALSSTQETAGCEYSDLIANNLALLARSASNADASFAFFEAMTLAVAHYERVLPADHPVLPLARCNLASSKAGLGELAAACALFQSVLKDYERTLPADHLDLLPIRLALAVSMYEMGDLASARSINEAVLEAYEPKLPADHPDLLTARLNLGNTMAEMGEMAGARALHESVLEAYERSLPTDHPDILSARLNLANTMSEMGEMAGARALTESVLEVYERTLPTDHPQLAWARGILAASMYLMGDLAGAQVLMESVLESLERDLPPDHLEILYTRENLAVLMNAMGDLAGARALNELVVDGYERKGLTDHPALLDARLDMAIALSDIGDLAGARALIESVLEVCERSLAVDHPNLLRARQTLATSMSDMGDIAGARALEESVLEAYERTLPANHPDLQGARANLAISLAKMGDIAGAQAIEKSLVESLERSLPADHPDLLGAKINLVGSTYQLGDLDSAYGSMTDLCAGARARVLASLSLAPRQARHTVGSLSHHLNVLYFFSETGGPALQYDVFNLSETMRLVACEAARSLGQFGGDPELAPILAAADVVRTEQGDLAARTSRSAEDRQASAAELTRLSLVRERLERTASRLLAERGIVTEPIEAQALAAVLRQSEVVVGYRRMKKWHQDETGGEFKSSGDHLFAHVLRSDKTLARIDLGLASELEALAAAWRLSLNAPIESFNSRGIGVEVSRASKQVEPHAGVQLRKRLLDSVLAAAGDGVERIFMCSDDLMFALPLDALPSNDSGSIRVGDNVRIVNEVSFARLLKTTEVSVSEPSLLSLGGVDYDASPEVPRGYVASAAPIAEPEAPLPAEKSTVHSKRGTTGLFFKPLPATMPEAETTARIFEERFEKDPVLLTSKETTKAALFAAASGKRYVHLATHGWFAPESVKSQADAKPQASTFVRMSVEERITGFAPMTLCGLALAGANHGADSLGRVKGILTAEELCTLDLSQCELAVLSACETNVGIRRAGQGIQSLQAALYAAGARTSITSLWKVDDAATRRLMEIFYTNLWIEKMPKSDALWAAKCTLRDEGHPPAHWAAWVMTGDPE